MTSMIAQPAIRVLVVGGSGALGAAFPKALAEMSPTSKITTVDFSPFPSASSPPSQFTHHHVIVPREASMASIPKTIIPALSSLDQSDKQSSYDLIINAGGTWAGGQLPTPQKKEESSDQESAIQEMEDYLKGFDINIPANLGSMALATALAGRYLPTDDSSSGGMLQLTGAAASAPSAIDEGMGSFMPSYVTSKGGANYLTKVAHHDLFKRNPKNRAAIVHPVTIDTPMNRVNMTHDDSWTTPSTLASMMLSLYYSKPKKGGGEKGVREYLVNTSTNGTTLNEIE
jgi:NAD(P)-dependent dehydrogenase (short-subunit alcohol dehydrogenase family)